MRQLRERRAPKQYAVDPFVKLGVVEDGVDERRALSGVEDLDDADFNTVPSVVDNSLSSSDDEMIEDDDASMNDAENSDNYDEELISVDADQIGARPISKRRRSFSSARQAIEITSHKTSDQHVSHGIDEENARLARRNPSEAIQKSLSTAAVEKIARLASRRASRYAAALANKLNPESVNEILGRNEDLMPDAIFGPFERSCAKIDSDHWTRVCAVESQHFCTSLEDLDILTDFDVLAEFPSWSAISLQFAKFEQCPSPPITLDVLKSVQVPSRPAVVLNAGFSVWGMDWCYPNLDSSLSRSKSAYLAVAGYNSTTDHYAIGEAVSCQAAIQIWKIDSLKENEKTSKVTLDMMLVHNWGICFDMKWWPMAVEVPHSSSNQSDSNKSIPRLGILGGCFSDGSFRMLVVPHPTHIRKAQDNIETDTLFVRIHSPLVEVSSVDTIAFKFAFGGVADLAIGYANGFLSLHDLTDLVSGNVVDQELDALVYFPAHDSFIRQVSFSSGVTPAKPTQLLTTGSDGRVLLWDLRDLFFPMHINRTQAIMTTCLLPRLFDALLFTDSDNTIRYVSVDDISKSVTTHSHRAIIWTMTDSSFHPFLASVAADGIVKLFNLNRLRSQRSTRPIESSLYELRYDDITETVIIIDDVPCRETNTSALKRINQFAKYFSHQVALQQVCWSHDPHKPTWIATAGSAGIIRIENAAAELHHSQKYK